MDELIKTADHWPIWLIAIAVCFTFFKDILELIFNFANGNRGKNNQRDRDDGGSVSHADIYTRLGQGNEMMSRLHEDIGVVKQDVSKIQQEMLAHIHSDAKFATDMLVRLDQLLVVKERAERDYRR